MGRALQPLRDEGIYIIGSGDSYHPREEHLIPLMVAAGAAEADEAVLGWSGAMSGKRLSAFHFGV